MFGRARRFFGMEGYKSVAAEDEYAAASSGLGKASMGKGPGAGANASASVEPAFSGDGLSDFDIGTCVGTSSVAVRLGFIRKVYGILSVQLALTFVISLAFMLVTPMRHFIMANQWFVMVNMVATFGLIIALMCFKDHHPLNMKLLMGFTACESVLVASVCAAYAEVGLGYVVAEAFFITMCVFGGLTAYCFISKKDFSFLGGFLYASLTSLLLASIVNIFLYMFHSPLANFMNFAIACFGSLLFSGYILFDTSNIIHSYSADQYIEAAVALYLDLINLFLLNPSYPMMPHVILYALHTPGTKQMAPTTTSAMPWWRSAAVAVTSSGTPTASRTNPTPRMSDVNSIARSGHCLSAPPRATVLHGSSKPCDKNRRGLSSRL
ncbi:Protein lifeguard 4 [Porphyridium purpureum]|uniref:Protein lifeguard 4 n=1 Tax=Porphyridium purpureum TaxID=35688 RepID=A0A5J4YZ56_PORPP|nr:Protein lifeguard 4 [Porphyridium purpureum]|eukprot:POR9790..scf209_3